MNFAGMIKQTLVDYPGQVATIVFTQGCNLRCPFCHNGHLVIKPGRIQEEYITQEEVLQFLEERKGFIDALVVSGGEPTLHRDLPDFLKQVKRGNYLIKLDTNGTSAAMLTTLLENNLLDYVAMDIKAPLDYDKYEQASGKLTPEQFFNIRNSINLLRQAKITVEFRTTVIPVLHSVDDIKDIARSLEGFTYYTLQQFNPEHTLNPSYGEVKPFTAEEMQDLAEQCKMFVKNVRVANI